jgi:hypothetical protein
MRHPLLLALAVLLLAAGTGPYAIFAGHVLDRGDAVIREAWDSESARLPLILAGAGIAAFAASGILGLAALRGARAQPLAGLGIPLAAACAVGLLAFEAGPGVFYAGGAVLACFVLSATAATALGREQGLGWRVALRSWLAAGTLLTLLVMAFGALGVLEKQLPRVPWSAVLAGIALATLMRALARHVTRTGQDPAAAALRHEQVRTGLDDGSIRAVAARLHPFIEEGRGGAGYDALAAELAARTGGSVPARPASRPGPRMAPPLAGLAAALRAAAFALPPALLLSGVWAIAVPLAVFGLLLPATRATLLPRREALPAAWWLASALLAGGGAALLHPLGGLLALPYLGLALWARTRRLPEEAAALRAGKARAIAGRRTVQAVQGALVAGAFLALPLALAGLPALIGVALPQAPLPFVLAGALGGALWALGAVAAGTAAQRSLAALDGAHAQQEAARRAFHRAFLENLEAS